MNDPRVIAAVGHGPEGWRFSLNTFGIGGPLWRSADSHWEIGAGRTEYCQGGIDAGCVTDGDPAEAIARIATVLPVLEGEDPAEALRTRVAELEAARDSALTMARSVWPLRLGTKINVAEYSGGAVLPKRLVLAVENEGEHCRQAYRKEAARGDANEAEAHVAELEAPCRRLIETLHGSGAPDWVRDIAAEMAAVLEAP